MRRDHATTLFGLFFLAGTAFLWWEGTRHSLSVQEGSGIAYDPLFFPNVLLVLGAVCASCIIVLGLVTKDSDGAEPRWGLLCALVLLIAAYFWAMATVGFVVVTAPFIVLFCGLLGYRRWTAVVLTASGITASVWYVFTAWLKVPLPAPTWLEGLIG